MERLRKFVYLAPLLVACGSGASEYREADDFAVAVERVEAYAEEYGAANTLLVVDIDNTLLAMRNPLGSDQWFEWQEYLRKNEPESPLLVAKEFPQLLEAQGLLFTIGRMRPPQTDLPALVERVQSLGVPTLVLTSRGEDFRPATERELKNNGYDFASSVLPTEGIPAGRYLPYDPKDVTTAGLTAEEADLFELGEPREVSFEDGIMMSSGQHKGAMLLTILQHAKQLPQAVVFVDDHGRHVHRIYDALERRGIEISAIHYHREDLNVARFRYGDKTEVDRRWRRLEAALTEALSVPVEAPAPALTP
ncbi:DUF2608 domain-containing protein [Botrimarina hoheduenensis]|uniref:Uncharacterized protein n=1 Tax=Botrimarina hoheduenensis TaxID=2528000 RepID=A0A5C5WDC9_9BACT|nr:DUF2608 domain-containing protein [Botrimarina hoheduenensis]TWT48684.1 hypothetical protein Pla111_04590 [Botrimarina hoheduenensis]